MFATLHEYDVLALNFFRSLADPNSPFQVGLVGFLSDLEVALVILLLVWLWLFGVFKKQERFKKESLMIFYSIVFAFAIYLALNQLLPMRPRPESMSAIRPLVDHLPDNSFPSGHAIFAGASIMAAFLYTRRWIAWILLVTGLVMIISRVIAWVHYPGDITVGFLIGLLVAWMFLYLKDSKAMWYLIRYPILIAHFIKL